MNARRVLYAGLGLVLLFLVSSTLIGFQRLLSEQHSLGEVLPGEALWAVTQAELEVKNTLLAFADTSDETGEAVRLRLDLLWSRLVLLEEGRVVKGLARVPGSAAVVADLRAALTALDEAPAHGPAAPASAPDPRPARLALLGPRLHRLAVALVQADEHAKQARVAQTIGLLSDLRWSVLAALAFGVIIAILLLRKNHEASREMDGRRAIEHALRESEARYREAAHVARLGHYAWDDGARRYVHVSEEFAAILGHTRESFMRERGEGGAAFGIVHEDDRERMMAALERLRGGVDAGFELEFRAVWPDGTVRHVRDVTRVASRDRDGHCLLWGIWQDVTELKRIEDGLRVALEEADRASRARSEFLARISHELRTPMNSILGFGQLLEVDLDRTLDAGQRRYVDHIMVAGRHLLALIDDVLDLSHIESGRMQMFVVPVEVGAMIEECIGLVEGMAVERRITVENLIPSGKEIWIDTDRTRLRQVLLNLLTNAIKYNEPDGQVEVRARAEARDHLLVTVSDTGPGIPPERLEDVFEPFTRIESPDAPVEGSGVGLSVTRALIEVMGGDIRVESPRAGGTVALFTLPGPVRDRPGRDDDHRVARAEPADVDASGDLILCVDDDPANLLLVREIFARRPELRLMDAPDAQIGIEMARNHQPDVVLMDLNLPGLDGVTALERLREDPRTDSIPVIAVSADASRDRIEQVLEAGFFDYVVKPIALDQLDDAVARARQSIRQGD